MGNNVEMLSLDDIRDKQAQVRRNTSNFYRPQDGPTKKNTIRVLSFEHVVTREDVAAKYFKPEKLGKKLQQLDRPICIQFGIRGDNRPVHATKETLAKYNELKKKVGKEGARDIAPQKKWVVNVIDTQDPEPSVKIYQMPKAVFDSILDYLMDPEYGREMLGVRGRDFNIYFDKTKGPSGMYKVAPRKEGMSKVYPSDLEKNVFDLWHPMVYDMLAEQADGTAVPATAVDPDEAPEESPQGEDFLGGQQAGPTDPDDAAMPEESTEVGEELPPEELPPEEEPEPAPAPVRHSAPVRRPAPAPVQRKVAAPARRAAPSSVKRKK